MTNLRKLMWPAVVVVLVVPADACGPGDCCDGDVDTRPGGVEPTSISAAAYGGRDTAYCVLDKGGRKALNQVCVALANVQQIKPALPSRPASGLL